MGAPLGFKTFVTGDVLTAGDTNGYLMQGVWTFASAAARDAAVTSPQEGNMCYLKDTDAVQYYSGSAWTAVGGSSGFTKVTSNTFSGVTSVSLPNSTFTSTYTNYKVILIIASSSGNTAITGRYRASGTDNTSGIYNSSLTTVRVDTGALESNGSSNATSFKMGYNASGNPGPFGISWDFLSPQAAAEKQIAGTGFGYNVGIDSYTAYWFGGHGNSTSQFDSFSWISSTGTITGSYYVYGMAN
jgi:hypothetical protein